MAYSCKIGLAATGVLHLADSYPQLRIEITAIRTLKMLIVGRVNLAVLAIILKGNIIICEPILQTHNGDSPNASGGPSRALASTYHCHAYTNREFHEPVQLILPYSPKLFDYQKRLSDAMQKSLQFD